MKPPYRKRSPSLTDSLKDMPFPTEAGSDAAVRKAFETPPPPRLIRWEVGRPADVREFIEAERLMLTQCGAVAFMHGNDTTLLLAKSEWLWCKRLESAG